MGSRMGLVLSSAAVAALGLASVSCGGGSGGASDLVLIGFNLPNIAGVAMNTPLIYTFSDDVDPRSVTPDTVQVVGSPSFTFEKIVVDGNTVAQLPFVPNFEDYSDSGLAQGVSYTVSLPVFPAVDTVRSVHGRPLVSAESFSFTTNPVVTFIEPRRPLVHEPGPISGPNMRGDEDGCLQDRDNGNYTYPGFQFGTSPDARLLCLKHEGQPNVITDQCIPFHNQRAVGTPSAVAPGMIDMPAIRIRFNEPLDPLSAVPWNPANQLASNVQLWFVGDSEANPIVPAVQVRTNKPLVVQNLDQTEVILVPLGQQPQGTYLVNVQGVRDLPGNQLDSSNSPSPVQGGYTDISDALVGVVPPGYRLYFRTLQLPSTPGSITESFGNNLGERTTGLFTYSVGNNAGVEDPAVAIPGSPAAGSPGYTLVQGQPGQAATANWNNAYKWLGIAVADVGTKKDDGVGRLKAVFAPYLGNGTDGVLNVVGTVTLSSAGGDFNNDGIFEFETLIVQSGGALVLQGPKPVMILVRGNCVIDGTIRASGSEGGPGIDTDGSSNYTNPLAMLGGGLGGAAGPGGGAGGRGAPQLTGATPGDAASGGEPKNVLGEPVPGGAGLFGLFGDATNQGGGAGGYGTGGSGGSGAGNGGVASDPEFTRQLAFWAPDRCYQPGADLAGGGGGAGGGAEDDNGASEVGDGQLLTVSGTGQMAGGDDGGGGGGGGGGGVWIIARAISVGSTGIIRADGGRGGHTYGAGNQLLIDPDGNTAGDEFIDSVIDPNLAGTGEGGGGGGGAGGAILLQAKDSLTIAANAVLSAVGGAPGTTGTGADGGQGGDGRIALMGFAGSSEGVAATVVVDPAAVITPSPGVSGAAWQPTVDCTSQGVSAWIYNVTNTITFPVAPFWTDNFQQLIDAGLVRGLADDFEAVLEFQGADNLSPDLVNPTAATTLTPWTPDVTDMDGKLYFRWRWRFYVAHPDGNVGNNPDFDPALHPMPAVLDFTVPFEK